MGTLKIVAVFGVILLLFSGYLGCDSSTSSGGGSAKDVQYTVNGLVISHNADNERDYTVFGVGSDYKVLTWYCGNYKGFIKKYVQLTFLKQNSWILDREEMSSGSCR